MRKFLLILAVLICAFALQGCGAKIEYFYQQSGDEYKYEYKVCLPSEVESELNATASGRTATEKWTVDDYMSTLATAFGYDYATSEADSEKIFALTRTVSKDDLPDDEEDEDETTVEVVPHFFTREYRYTTVNPLADAMSQYEKGEGEPETLFYILNNGFGTVLPSVKNAFPTLSDEDLSDLTLNFYWRTDDLETADGEEVRVNGKRYLKWTASYDGEVNKITYSYYGVNPLGWYVVILGVSVLTIVIILVVAKKKGREGRLVEAKKQPKKRYGDTSIVYDEANFINFPLPSTKNIDPFLDTEKEENERLLKRIDEFFSPEEAEEIKKKMDEKKD